MNFEELHERRKADSRVFQLDNRVVHLELLPGRRFEPFSAPQPPLFPNFLKVEFNFNKKYEKIENETQFLKNHFSHSKVDREKEWVKLLQASALPNQLVPHLQD